jgi:uncharacterized protein (TIGR04222 family)
VRQVIRGVPGYRPTRDLDPYEVAYLGGGPQRAAEVIIAEQVDRGAVRVDSSGRLFQTGQGAPTGARRRAGPDRRRWAEDVRRMPQAQIRSGGWLHP